MALLLSALAMASAAGQPDYSGAFAARFDCRTSSDLNGSPYRQNDRTVITIRSWKERSQVLIERHLEGKVQTDETTMTEVYFRPSGRFQVFFFSYSMISLEQLTDRADSFRYHSSNEVSDAGFANEVGTCSANIKKLPKPEPVVRIK